MSRGKKIDIEEYITRLEPFLKEGCSLSEACQNAFVPYTTVIDYQNKDEELRNKIKAWQNTPILAARKSLNRDVMSDGNLALKYLERKLKSEFSTRGEITGADGGPVDTKYTIEFVDAKEGKEDD